MNAKQLRQLADELSADILKLDKIKPVLREAQSRLSTREPDAYDLYATGAILHNLYQGVESLCLRVAKEIDRRVPDGTHWHRDLLEQMAQPIPATRPALFHSSTLILLEDYRRFRHLVRNIYGFELDEVQLRPLLEKGSFTIDAVIADVEQFKVFLHSLADENV